MVWGLASMTITFEAGLYDGHRGRPSPFGLPDAGNPNGEGLPRWPWFQASVPKVMVIDANPHTIGAPGLRRYEFLDTH